MIAIEAQEDSDLTFNSELENLLPIENGRIGNQAKEEGLIYVLTSNCVAEVKVKVKLPSLGRKEQSRKFSSWKSNWRFRFALLTILEGNSVVSKRSA
jgi:hypothetical protein